MNKQRVWNTPACAFAPRLHYKFVYPKKALNNMYFITKTKKT